VPFCRRPTNFRRLLLVKFYEVKFVAGWTGLGAGSASVSEPKSAGGRPSRHKTERSEGLWRTVRDEFLNWLVTAA
jgi:hypothetical protein